MKTNWVIYGFPLPGCRLWCFALHGLLILLSVCVACSAQSLHPEWRGLLASPGFEGQPIKGVYFFPGEGDANNRFYTTHPTLEDDLRWNSDPSSRTRVLTRMERAGVNTVVMSYWGNVCCSPMVVNSQNGLSVPEVPQAVEGHHLLVIPAIESGGSDDPAAPRFIFQNDFPHPANSGAAAPGLVQRIGWLVNLFGSQRGQWAQMYDRTGHARFAVNVLHVCSDIGGVNDTSFAAGFDQVAAQVWNQYHLSVGFTLDTIGGCGYVATPAHAGSSLNSTAAVLSLMGFESEVFSGKVQPGNNNDHNLTNLADWKKAAVSDWLATGVPMILDVSNGYDGHIVFPRNPGWWGDSSQVTDDRWRNWMSELKGNGIKGIVMDTWNGYTEGYAAVPSREHGSTVTEWLKDLLEPDPRVCSHMHYVNNVRSHRVYGAICEKWITLGADRAFGAPVSEELATAHGRVSRFADGKAIYWSGGTGAHELHGLIYQSYLAHKEDQSCLGLPISDEEATSDGRQNRFEHGLIAWTRNAVKAEVICRIQQAGVSGFSK
jgi:hypothetical protein